MNDNIQAFLTYLNAVLPQYFNPEGEAAAPCEGVAAEQLVQHNDSLTKHYQKKNLQDTLSFSDEGVLPVEMNPFPKEARKRPIEVDVALRVEEIH